MPRRASALDRRRVGVVVADQVHADLQPAEPRIVERLDRRLEIRPGDEDVGGAVVRRRRGDRLEPRRDAGNQVAHPRAAACCGRIRAAAPTRCSPPRAPRSARDQARRCRFSKPSLRRGWRRGGCWDRRRRGGRGAAGRAGPRGSARGMRDARPSTMAGTERRHQRRPSGVRSPAPLPRRPPARPASANTYSIPPCAV